MDGWRAAFVLSASILLTATARTNAFYVPRVQFLFLLSPSSNSAWFYVEDLSLLGPRIISVKKKWNKFSAHTSSDSSWFPEWGLGFWCLLASTGRQMSQFQGEFFLFPTISWFRNFLSYRPHDDGETIGSPLLAIHRGIHHSIPSLSWLSSGYLCNLYAGRIKEVRKGAAESEPQEN